jgi:hypothetical protein
MDTHEPGSRRSFLKGALATPLIVAGATALGPAQAHSSNTKPVTATGPSTRTEPYLLPSIVGAKTVSILTVGDSVGGYRMVGLPDGLGAFKSDHREFTLLMNHEITSGTPGVVRAHGSNGAFVSRWEIDSESLRVKKGQDLTPSPTKVYTWDVASGKYVAGTTQWQRFCSADLPAESAFYARGLGTRERLYMGGEEFTDGRAWARVVTGPRAGEAWELPRMGKMAYENAVACPYPQANTIVVLTDDSNLSTAPTGFPSEVYVYVGRKQRSGTPIEQAGLTNGLFYGVTITVDGQPVTEEHNVYGLGTEATGYKGKGRFGLYNLGDVSAMNATQIEAASIAGGVARLQRCEDGAWDPREGRQDNFYFVTTASDANNCRLWHLNFDDIERPEMGGTIEIVLRGDEGHRMLDNVAIDKQGRILMDEDPGNSTRISKIWLYSIDTRQFLQVAAHNPKYFDGSTANNPTFLTQDEESSGIIDAGDILGDGWFLLDVQVHKANPDAELVEMGQLLALYVHPDVGMLDSDGHGRGRESDDDRRDRRS